MIFCLRFCIAAIINKRLDFLNNNCVCNDCTIVQLLIYYFHVFKFFANVRAVSNNLRFYLRYNKSSIKNQSVQECDAAKAKSLIDCPAHHFLLIYCD